MFVDLIKPVVLDLILALTWRLLAEAAFPRPSQFD